VVVFVNAHLRRAFYLFAAGFFGLVAMLAYWQVYSREALANNPENGFQTQRSISSPRGLILAGDGETVLARSEKRETPQGPVYDRVYPLGAPFSNVVGYWSTRYGATGIEIANNTDLSSIAGEPQTLDDLINRATGGPQPGNNVVLTLDPELQELAYQELQQSVTGRGSIVAINPKNGEILAMATSPSFDPNDIDDNYPELASAPNAPLINRATQSLYPPGSGRKTSFSTAGPTSCRATPCTTSRARISGRSPSRGRSPTPST
jgi:peptidoglycan glycosyltransferase